MRPLAKGSCIYRYILIKSVYIRTNFLLHLLRGKYMNCWEKQKILALFCTIKDTALSNVNDEGHTLL